MSICWSMNKRNVLYPHNGWLVIKITLQHRGSLDALCQKWLKPDPEGLAGSDPFLAESSGDKPRGSKRFAAVRSLGSAGQKPPSLQDPALCTSSSVSRLLISSVDWLSFSSSPWWRKGTEKKTSGMLVFDFHCDSAPKSAQLLWSVCRKRNQSILIVKENSCASAGRTNECQHFWNPFLDRGLFENDLRFQEFVFS